MKLKDWKIGDIVRQRHGNNQGKIIAFGYDCDGEIEKICFKGKALFGRLELWESPTHLILVANSPKEKE